MTHYDLSLGAEADLRGIARYTLESHGADQVRKYVSRLDQCMQNMAQGKGHIRQSDHLPDGKLYTKCEHHYVFGLDQKDRKFLVLAILHEKMDYMTRLQGRL